MDCFSQCLHISLTNPAIFADACCGQTIYRLIALTIEFSICIYYVTQERKATALGTIKDVPRHLDARINSSPTARAQYISLSGVWQPLRKRHSDTALHFPPSRVTTVLSSQAGKTHALSIPGVILRSHVCCCAPRPENSSLAPSA